MPQLALPDGETLAFVDTGGSGPAVLLVHGYPLSSHLWSGVTPHLDGYRVVCPDLLGFGASTFGGELTIERHARALHALVEHLGLSEVHLVVHDLGGPVGVTWALDHPDLVVRLTLLNSFFSPRFRLSDELLLVMMRIPGLRALFTLATVGEQVLRMGFAHRSVLDDHRCAIQAPFDGPRRVLLIRTFLEAFGRKGRPELARVERELPRLPEFRLRIGLADRDPFCDAYMRRLLAALPDVPVRHFRGHGHFFPLECPQELAAWLVEES